MILALYLQARLGRILEVTMSEHGQQKLSDVNTDAAKSRRKFIKRGSAGVLLASLPAASVWGQDNLIAGSIAASGHGSDFAGGQPIALLSPGYWKNHQEHWSVYSYNPKFFDVFRGTPFGTLKRNNGEEGPPNLTDVEKMNLTFKDILENPGGGKGGLGGQSNVNWYLVEILLCAANHGNILKGQMVNFPVIKGSSNTQGQAIRGLFGSLDEFAQYLYGKAGPNPAALGLELENLLNNNHA